MYRNLHEIELIEFHIVFLAMQRKKRIGNMIES